MILGNASEASGLADMLHQYLCQTLEEPDKQRKARRLRGALVYCAAEDPEIRVRIRFTDERVCVEDVGRSHVCGPRLTADFLSTAHLTSGEAGPFSLLVRRKLKARFHPGQIGFLLRFLSLMKISPDAREPHTGRRWVAVIVVLLAVACVAGLYLAYGN